MEDTLHQDIIEEMLTPDETEMALELDTAYPDPYEIIEWQLQHEENAPGRYAMPCRCGGVGTCYNPDIDDCDEARCFDCAEDQAAEGDYEYREDPEPDWGRLEDGYFGHLFRSKL